MFHQIKFSLIKMNIHQFQRKINFDLDSFLFFYSFLFVGLTMLWNIYFARMILHLVNLYRKSVESAKNDDIFNNYSELALHYKVGIVKYAFLLAINITEISSLIIYISGLGLTHVNPLNATSNTCLGKISNVELYVVIGTPMEAVFISVGHVGLLMSLALVICLMKYLDATYHNINVQPVKFIKIFMTVSCIAGVLLFVSGSIHQSFVLERVAYPIILAIYTFIWMKIVRDFHKTLKWQSLELKVRGRSNQIVRRAIKSSKHFAIIMCSLGIGIICLTLAQNVIDLFFIFTMFAYCPKIVAQLYGTPHYTPLFTTKPQIDALVLSSEITSEICVILFVIAYLAMTSQYLLVTFVFFGGMVVRKLKYRFGRIKTRFTPSLTDPLLIS